jgi:aldehyde:ferredoxin oxidoreductase
MKLYAVDLALFVCDGRHDVTAGRGGHGLVGVSHAVKTIAVCHQDVLRFPETPEKMKKKENLTIIGRKKLSCVVMSSILIP